MKGVRVETAFGEYTVPPVSLRTHFDTEAEQEIISDVNSDPKAWTRAAIAFVLAVLRRNYPDLTEDQFFESASANDLGPIMIAAKSQSGYVQRPLVSGTSVSVVENSSDTSSTPPAGSPTTSSTG